MRALSFTLAADRQLLKPDGLHRSFLLDGASSSGERRVAKQLLPGLATNPDTVDAWLGLVGQNAALGLPCGPRIEDWGVHGEAAYMVSAHAAGVPLSATFSQLRACDPQRAVELIAYVGAAVLEALAQARQREPTLVHLDLDPDSITVRPDGSLQVPEFGLWTALDPAEIARCRFDSGRVQYCSPEVVQSRVADSRSDIFSLGVLLSRMVTGAPTFPGGTQLVIAMAIAEGKRSPLRERAPQAAADLCEVLELMLATACEERFQTPDAARSALLSTMRAGALELSAQLGTYTAAATGSAALTQVLASPLAPPRAREAATHAVAAAHSALGAAGPRREPTRATVEPTPPRSTSPQPPPLFVSLPGEPCSRAALPQVALDAARAPSALPALAAPPAASQPPSASRAEPALPLPPLPQALALLDAGELHVNDGRTSFLRPPVTPAPRANFEHAVALPATPQKWRDPTLTVFQAKQRQPSEPPAGAVGPRLRPTVLLSMLLGFSTVIALYLAYRLL